MRSFPGSARWHALNREERAPGSVASGALECQKFVNESNEDIFLVFAVQPKKFGDTSYLARIDLLQGGR